MNKKQNEQDKKAIDELVRERDILNKVSIINQLYSCLNSSLMKLYLNCFLYIFWIYKKIYACV